MSARFSGRPLPRSHRFCWSCIIDERAGSRACNAALPTRKEETAMNRKDSEDLVRVGPGTVMGNLMRQYWVPAAMSSELQRDGAPIRLMLLGEQLIAFRDSSGRVGVMDHRCPHRFASLFLGRNEENGIRCVYHRWPCDTDGNRGDKPNIAG